MYADDIVLLSSSQAGLQFCLDKLSVYCSKWDLHVNLKKTRIIVFQKRKNLGYYNYNGNNIPIVESYRYLGIDFHKSGTFSFAIKELVLKAKRAYFATMQNFNQVNGTSLKILLKIFYTLIFPIFTYCSEVWAAFIPQWCKSQNDDDILNTFIKNVFPFEKLLSKVCKHFLGVGRLTSSIASLAEIGVYPLSIKLVTNAISYFARISNFYDKNTLLLNAFQENKVIFFNGNQNNNYINTINSLLNLCNISKFTYKRDTTSFSTCLENRIGNTFKHKYELFFQKTIRNNPNSKLRTYIQFKSIYSVEKYLHLIRNPLFRKSFSKLRLSNHKLPIEKSR